MAGYQDVDYDSDDFQYALDLGLLTKERAGAEAANPLYREVLARQLTYNMQENLPLPWWPWTTAAGRLDVPALVDAFLQWWRANADVLQERLPLYPEVVPHLTFLAFAQRVVNRRQEPQGDFAIGEARRAPSRTHGVHGGGQVHRESAAGSMALDLLIEYGPDRFVVELKRVRPRDSLETVRTRGIAQIRAYLDTLGIALGWLLLFDLRPGRTWEERLWREEVDVDGRKRHLVGA